MRISDWSSDVCSSDLLEPAVKMECAPIAGAPAMIAMAHRANVDHAIADAQCSGDPAALLDAVVGSIGRATAGMRRIGVGWVECLETEIDRGFRPFQADLGSLEGNILPHREALDLPGIAVHVTRRSEEYTSDLQSLQRHSYAVFCWQKHNSK